MSREDKIIEILEKLTNKVEIIAGKIDLLAMKIENIELREELPFISMEEDRMGMDEAIFINIGTTDMIPNSTDKIDRIEEEIKELRNDLSNIQQITAMNLGDIGKLKATK